eukprot:jgi/Orpsp1_1/1174520/evm.model.c7180000050429.1
MLEFYRMFDIDYILYNYNVSQLPLEIIPYVLNGIEYKLSIEGNDRKKAIEYLKDIESFTLNYSFSYESHSSYLNSQSHVDRYLTVLTEYNNAISFALYYGYINNGSNIYPVEVSTSVKSILKYYYTKKFEEVLNSIIKANPDKFNDNLNHSNGNSYLQYGRYGDRAWEYTTEDLKKVIIKNTEKSRKEDLMTIFIEAADPISMIELKKAYYSEYLFVRSCSPAEVNIDDIRDVTTNINVLQNSVLQDYKFFYNYMYSSFLEFLTEVSKFDSNATPKDYLWNSKGLIPSSVYKNAESFSDIFTNIKSTIFKLDKNDLMTDEIRNQIEEAAKKLNSCIRGSRYLITNTAGRVFNNMFDSLVKNYYEMVLPAKIFFEGNLRVDNPSEYDMDYTHDNKDNTIENLDYVQTYNNKIYTSRNDVYKPFDLNKEKI